MKLHSIGGLLVLILVVQLSACANVPGDQQVAQQQAKVQEADAYCERLYADSRLDPIRRKVPLNLNFRQPIPVEMMGNGQIPTEDEAKLILIWAELRQDCQQRALTDLGPPPAHLAALRMANSQVMAELYARRITYGQFAGQLNQNVIAFTQQDQALRSQEQRDAVQMQQAFTQNLLQQQQLNLQRQQLLNQQVRPVNSVNCTTQYIGNTAYTNCH